MKTNDALNILGLSTAGYISIDDIKTAYHKAAFKYLPDRNPAGLEMIQLVNAAYKALENFSGEIGSHENDYNYGEDINTALNAIINLASIFNI